MDYPYIETGTRILELRKKRCLTREKLAEMPDISIQFLSDIEKGRKSMTIATLQRLSEALMVTTDYIVFGESRLQTEIDPEFMELCKTLSPDKQQQAVKLLRVFFEAVTGN